MKTFKTANGGATVKVPNYMADTMRARKCVEVADEKTPARTKTDKPADRTATTEPNDTAKTKGMSKVQPGETRTR